MIMRLFLIGLLSLSLNARSANDTPDWHLYPSYARHLCRLPAAHKKAIFFRADTDEKIVALTFDDGPLKRTPALLKLLKQRHTAATFFLLAPQVNQHNALLYDDPLFEAALHGYHHLDFRRLSQKHIRKELDRALTIFHAHGLHPRYFRPPFGMTSTALLHQLKKRQLTPILWSLDSQDWHHLRGKKFIQNIHEHLTPGSVILLHDQSTSLRDLSRLLNVIRQAGYRIVPLEELIQKGWQVPCPQPDR